jgi:hypothetical protein
MNTLKIQVTWKKNFVDYNTSYLKKKNTQNHPTLKI